MEIILATRNPRKAAEIQALFSNSLWRLITLDEAGVEGAATEDGASEEENALKKARYAHERAKGYWVIADDTGLAIRGLKGAPGRHAATWAGENVPTETTTKFCIEQTKNLNDRHATFKTVAVAISPQGEEFVFVGELEGTLLRTPRVKPHEKMPYSCLFVPLGENLSFAEMDVGQINRISHRSRAFNQLLALLEERL